MADENLQSLRSQPFALLLALEQAVLGAAGRVQRKEGLWVGVAFLSGGHAYIASRSEIREVITWPEATRVPRTQPWLRGLANVRGQLVPVTDLGQWAGGAETTLTRNSRVIVVNHPDIPAGILVDQVMGFRRYSSREASPLPEGIPDLLAPFLLGAYAHENEHWGVLVLHDLVESDAFLHAAS